MSADEILGEAADKLEPSRRKFILGLLAAGITAPSVASFVAGRVNRSSATSALPIRPASIIDSSGNFNMQWMDPSGNTYYDPSANYMYETYFSGNFLRDSSGNFVLDASGNLLCGTSGNILLDSSGNAIPNVSGNSPYIVHPSGNWTSDPSSNVIGLPIRDVSGNVWGSFIEMDPSGHAFYDQVFSYDNNGIIDWYSSPHTPGLACVVSANHIQVTQSPTTTVAPVTTTPASSTTTTTPVTPVTVSGTIPSVK